MARKSACSNASSVSFQTHSDPSRRLELKFRPDDPYCKCVYANRFSASCLLLKVKRNRSKDGEPYSVSIEGTVSTVYKFRGEYKASLPTETWHVSKRVTGAIPSNTRAQVGGSLPESLQSSGLNCLSNDVIMLHAGCSGITACVWGGWSPAPHKIQPTI